MACGPTHKFVGAAVGFCISAMENTNNQKTIDPISATALGSLFGALPDLLEPAINPHHRQFCHGLATLTAIGYGVRRAYLWKPSTDSEKFLRTILLVAGSAYISHLLLDCITPRSLPVFGKL
jgi:inner membrane protein